MAGWLDENYDQLRDMITIFGNNLQKYLNVAIKFVYLQQGICEECYEK
jgi:hypothetical protein